MKKEHLGTVLVIAGGLLWGTMGLFVKLLSNAGLHPVQITTIRLIIGTAALWIFVFLYNRKLLCIRLRDLPLFVVTGVFCITGLSLAYFTTITNTGMGVAAVLMYFAPVFVIFLSHIFFKERLTKSKIAACLMAFAGCALVSGILSVTRIEPLYLLTGLLSALFYGSYSIFSKFILAKGYNTLTLVAYTFLFATFAILFFVDVPALYHAIRIDKILLFYGSVLGIIACTLPYVLYTIGLSHMQPGKAAIMSSVEPASAAILGCIFYNEQLDIFRILGIVLVLSSVVVLNVRWRERTVKGMRK